MVENLQTEEQPVVGLIYAFHTIQTRYNNLKLHYK